MQSNNIGDELPDEANGEQQQEQKQMENIEVFYPKMLYYIIFHT
jgi:hypothetical protein